MQELYKTKNSNGEYSCGDIGITSDTTTSRIPSSLNGYKRSWDASKSSARMEQKPFGVLPWKKVGKQKTASSGKFEKNWS